MNSIQRKQQVRKQTLFAKAMMKAEVRRAKKYSWQSQRPRDEGRADKYANAFPDTIEIEYPERQFP